MWSECPLRPALDGDGVADSRNSDRRERRGEERLRGRAAVPIPPQPTSPGVSIPPRAQALNGPPPASSPQPFELGRIPLYRRGQIAQSPLHLPPRSSFRSPLSFHHLLYHPWSSRPTPPPCLSCAPFDLLVSPSPHISRPAPQAPGRPAGQIFAQSYCCRQVIRISADVVTSCTH